MRWKLDTVLTIHSLYSFTASAYLCTHKSGREPWSQHSPSRDIVGHLSHLAPVCVCL